MLKYNFTRFVIPDTHTHTHTHTHRAKLHHNAAAVHVPIGLENDHTGVVDVITKKAFYFEGQFG